MNKPVSIFGGDAERLSFLTDGVFAIVMTLMVIEIHAPTESRSEELGHALLELWPEFLAYGISFALLGIYWSAHHSMFRFIHRTSHPLVWLNIAFLAIVSLVPFSTSLLATHHDHPLAVGIYGGTLVLIGSALLPIWLHATKNRHLVDADLPNGVVHFGISRIAFGIVGYSIATVVGIILPWLGLVLFVCLPLAYIVPAIQVAWWRRFGLSHTNTSVPEAPHGQTEKTVEPERAQVSAE